jgi:hypothetical protein
VVCVVDRDDDMEPLQVSSRSISNNTRIKPRERVSTTVAPSSTWKAVIRKRGWPSAIKTFRTKRDAQDWARRTEEEMMRGVYIERANADRLLLRDALKRYLNEVPITKKPSTANAEQHKAKSLTAPRSSGPDTTRGAARGHQERFLKDRAPLPRSAFRRA